MITIVNSEDVRIEKPIAEALLQMLAALTTGSTVETIRPGMIRITKRETFRDAKTTFRGHPEAMYYLRILAKTAAADPVVFSNKEQ